MAGLFFDGIHGFMLKNSKNKQKKGIVFERIYFADTPQSKKY